MPGTPDRKAVAAPLVLGGAIFWLNDFLFLLSDFRLWLAADYVTRAMVIASCLAAIVRVEPAMLRPAAWKHTALWTVGLTAAGFVIDWAVGVTLGYDGLLHYPMIGAPLWLGIDTTIGLALVATSEEMLSRGMVFLALERLCRSPSVAQVAVSALWFASFHWSLGWGSMAAAALTGVVLMLSLRSTRSLLPAILAHYAINVVLFAVPQWLGYTG